MKKLASILALFAISFCAFSQNVIWSNDFSNCNDWVLSNAYEEGFTEYASDVNFSCGVQELSSTREFPIQSTTNSNGYMHVNSPHASYNSSDFVVENCWFQTSQPINITGLDDIYLRFETAHNSTFPTNYQSPSHAPRCLLEISTDGFTWPDISTTSISQAPSGTRFLLWPENLSSQETISNPKEEVFHLSQIASQQGVDQIWLRFRWVGVFDLNWMIDDVQIVTTPNHDLGISNAWLNDIWNNYEYAVVPVEMGAASYPVAMLAAVRNYSQTNQLAEVVVELNGQEFYGSAVIPAKEIDTVLIEVVYPQSVGTYDVVFNLPNDNNITNNVFVKPLEISDTRARQSFNSNLKELIIGSGVDLSPSSNYYYESYYSESQLSCIGLKVFFGPSTEVGAEVKIEITDVTSWEIGANELLASSDPFLISDEVYSQILSGQPIFIPFIQPINLLANLGYNARVKKVNELESISVLGEPYDPDYGGFVTTTDGFIQTDVRRPLNFTPAIELLFNITECNDPDACNFGEQAFCTYQVVNYLDCDGICLNDLNENGVCDELELEGCTNPFACNYQPLAYQDDGSCFFPESNLDCNGNCIVDLDSDGICEPIIYGCMEASACNYDPNATVNMYCQYSNTLMIQVFNDFNNNGIRDTEGIIEPFIAYSGEVYAPGSNSISSIGNVGTATIYDLSPNTTEIYFQPSSEFFTTPFPLNIIPISLPTCDTLEIPVIVEADCYYNFWSNLDNEYNILDCNNGFQVYSSLYNYSSQPMNGTVAFTFDPTLTINPFFTYINTDDNSETVYSISYPSPGVVIWELTNIPPGFDGNIWSHIPSPGVDYIGDFFGTTIEIQLYCEGNLILDELWNSQLEVLCAYDPNDIQGDPVGYTDNHFILEDTEIEYRIRFQNTGNAPAQNVRIENLIDIEKLDISTFQPTSASDPMTVTIGNDGMVNFMFNGIMLPDSGANFVESIGSLTYKIRTMPGVSPGDIIENTAGIYFDSNPPIITNTAFHEIYSCDEIPRYNEILEICFDEDFSHEITYPYLESTDWFVNGNFIADVTSFEHPIVFGSDMEIEVVMTNPLCQVTSQWEVEELPLPSNDVFVGVQGDLTAVEGVSWQWYNENGTVVEGATEQTFYTEIPGDYYVVITGENGCSVESELFTVVSIGELNDTRINAYPNPVFDNLQLQVSQSLIGSDYIVMDVTGREVMRGKITSMNNTIDFAAQSSGSYIIKVGNANVRVQK